MSTSGSFDFNLTTNEIVELSNKMVNALPEGQVLSNEQYSTGKKMLNMMVKSWRSKNIFLWQTDLIAVPLVASSVVLGTDGVDYECVKRHLSETGNAPTTGSSYGSFWKKLATNSGSSWAAGTNYTTICNPTLNTNITDIGEGFLRVLSSETNTQLSKITQSEFLKRFDSNNTGQPIQYWFKREETPSVFLHPYPDSSTNYILEFSAYRFPEDMDTGADNPDFLQEWLEALTFGLAERLAPQNGIFGNDLRDIQKMASRALEDARSIDHETGSIFISPTIGVV